MGEDKSVRDEGSAGEDKGNVSFVVDAQPPQSALKKQLRERLDSPARRLNKEELDSKLIAAEQRKKEAECAKASKATCQITRVAMVKEKAAEKEAMDKLNQAIKLESQLEKAEANRLLLEESKRARAHSEQSKERNKAADIALQLEEKEELASQRRAEFMDTKVKKLQEHSERIVAVKERRRSIGHGVEPAVPAI